ncbi:unnamed protein product [Schistosoma curassoni]|uniref:Ribosome biogenesis protein NOP53 n=1 Tax=Schistosoma curassoni TaxID=6186 RepID=A0A183KXH9_9TREM|nr:unnamed protein product [Schistosoma curassoni]
MQLDDLDFADDVALLSQTQQQIQEKTTSVAAASAAIGLNIHKGESRILRYNTTCNNRVTLDGEDLENVKTFTYLGSIIDEHGGSDTDVKARIGKARAAYLQLRNIWNSKQLSTNTKCNPKIKTRQCQLLGAYIRYVGNEIRDMYVLTDVPASIMPTGKGSTLENAVDKNLGNHSLPCPGQSYNPTLHDHLSLISRIKAIESAKQKLELKTERFVSSLRGVNSSPNPLKDMEKFLQSLNAESHVTKSSEDVDEIFLPRKKPKKVDPHKKMKNDLENLPKLLKEIKREKKTRERRKSAAKAKSEIRSKLKKVDLNIPFQLPNEISSSLRKLCVSHTFSVL